MFRKMPFILLAIIIALAVFDGWIPVYWKSFLYALSLSIKSVIVFILPFLIFMLLFKTMSQLAKSATKVILFVLAAVCCSNFISTMISYGIGSTIYHFDLSITIPKETLGLSPLWTFAIPKLIGNDVAMFSGVILGILCSFFIPRMANRVSTLFERAVSFIFRGFIFVIPVFIGGFIVKLIHDKMMEGIIRDYALIFIIVALAQFSYIAFIYLSSNRFRFSQFLTSLKNMLPAAIAGFGSMSSAAAMPLTLVAAEKNSKDPTFSRLVIPSTVNVHLIGDCFAIPIFAFAVMKNFGAVEPTFFSYLIFAAYFVMAKFSVAAIPGGGIIVMLPILESQLGFNAEMSSLITALYILFDPVITCANVCGNGGFAIALSKFKRKFIKAQEVTTQA